MQNSIKNYKYINHFKNDCSKDKLETENSLRHYITYSKTNNEHKMCKEFSDTNSFYFGVNYELSVILNKNFKSFLDKDNVSIKIARFNFMILPSNKKLNIFNFEAIAETNNSLIFENVGYNKDDLKKLINVNYDLKLMNYDTTNVENEEKILKFILS